MWLLGCSKRDRATHEPLRGEKYTTFHLPWRHLGPTTNCQSICSKDTPRSSQQTKSHPEPSPSPQPQSSFVFYHHPSPKTQDSRTHPHRISDHHMTIHKDLRVALFDPFEQGGAEGDVRDKVAGVVRGRFVVVVMGVVVWAVWVCAFLWVWVVWVGDLCGRAFVCVCEIWGVFMVVERDRFHMFVVYVRSRVCKWDEIVGLVWLSRSCR